MKLINAEVLKNYHACEEGYDNFVAKYPTFDGTFLEVLDLPNIPYNDKIWLAKKVLNTNQLIHFAILVSESVLNFYSAKFPTDTRISDCLTYMKTIVDFSMLTQEQRERLSTLRSGVQQARRAAADAAYAAAYAAYADAADARKVQEERNLQFLKMVSNI